MYPAVPTAMTPITMKMTSLMRRTASPRGP